MRKALVVGISHTHALRRALSERTASSVEFDINWLQGRPQPGRKEHGNATDGIVADKLRNLSAEDAAFFGFLGTNHHPWMFCADNPIRVIGLDDDPHDGEPAIMASLIRHHFQCLPNRTRLDLFLSASGTRSIYCIATPPPIEDGERMAARLCRDLKGRTIRPARTRLNIWRMEMAAVRNICTDAGVLFLDPPAEATTPQGFLAPCYSGEDTMHANAAYGELVLHQIETIMARDCRRW